MRTRQISRFHPDADMRHQTRSRRRLGCRRLHLHMAPLAAAAAMLALTLPAAAASGDLNIELNKLEPQQNSCRAYFVITNKSPTEYRVLKLDLVQFQPDGVIGRRFAIDLGPLKPQKRSVKLFDIDVGCDQVGSLLINDAVECASEAGPIPDCLADMTATSLTQQQLSK